MELDELRQALASGELYAPEVARPASVRDIARFVMTQQDFSTWKTSVERRFDQEVHYMDAELRPIASDVFMAFWHDGGTWVDISLSQTRVLATVHGVAQAEGGGCRIEAIITEHIDVHPRCDCAPSLPEYPLGCHRTECNLRTNRAKNDEDCVK